MATDRRRRLAGSASFLAFALGFASSGAAQQIPGLADSEIPTSPRYQALAEELSGLQRLAANSSASIEAVRSGGDRVFNEGAGSVVIPKVKVTPVDTEPMPDGSDVTVDKLFTQADDRIASMPGSMPTLLKDVLAKARERKGAIDFVPMPKEEEGVYLYTDQTAGGGVIHLNDDLRMVGALLIGSPFAFAVIVHEAAHALADSRKELSDTLHEHVIDDEVFAFTAMQQYLKYIDPKGERLPDLRRRVRVWMKEYPSAYPVLSKADAVLTSLDVLWGAKDLKKYTRDLGYRDGPGSHRDGPPSA